MPWLLAFTLKTILFFAVCIVGTYGFFLGLLHIGVLPLETPEWRVPRHDEAPFDPRAIDPATTHPLLRNMVLVDPEGNEVVGETAPAPAPVAPAEYLFIEIDAAVSLLDGPFAQIAVRGRGADCPSGFNPPRRKSQGWTPQWEGGSAVAARWCVQVASGEVASYRPINGAWRTPEGVLEADYAAQYLRFALPDGKFAAIKAAALAVCDESKGCGHSASVYLEADNAKIEDIVPVDNGEYLRIYLNADDASVQPVAAGRLPLKAQRGYRLAELP